YITENFGANASYVEGLYARYSADRTSVDESWRTFFDDLLSGNGKDTSAGTAVAEPAKPAPVSKAEPAKIAEAKPAPSIPADAEALAITGAAKKIVENMEYS